MHVVKAALLAAAGLGLAVAASAKEPEKRPTEKLICKSVSETGSLAKRKRQCFTRAEWEKIGEAHRRGWGRAIDDMRTRPSGS